MNRSSNSLWPILMIAAGALLIAAVSIWYLTSEGPFGSQEASSPVVLSEDTYGSIPRVSLADAKAAYDNGTAVFLDVRDEQSYARGHIQGALLIPLQELPDRLDELDRSSWIITYCT